MMIDDVFRITGRGTVAVGKVSAGTVKIGNSLILRKSNGTSRSVSVKGIEMSRKLVNEAERGVTIGLLLGNIEKEDVSKGDRLTAE
ncbi:MAG TPA: EF-Tu/IF-2/RF-3 family GTPase [Bacteroidia bacterium]